MPHVCCLCLCRLQISVDAPWLSNIQANCAVFGQGMLTCVDSATMSLYMLDLHSESQMTQILLQVATKIKKQICARFTC